ncbi:MAG TPA: ABC transporter ATP-binding protein [Mycobacteriales bacterium]|nr:ABC transporter ATP-binding protein [Mycobacteriales bacterium]
MSALLEVEGLSVSIGGTTLVDNLSFALPGSSALGLVGESGSGKTLTLRALLGLQPRGATVAGSVRFGGEQLVGRSERSMSRLRGAELAMVFQDPMSALNPVQRVGVQVAEGPRLHLGLSRSRAAARAVELLAKVGLPDPERTARRYPHELSGGMRQRVMIATALACEPKAVLCDEPTTALDVTVQAQVLRLLRSACDDLGAALLFVSHDLAVIRQICRQVAVMYAGRIVESGPIDGVFAEPRHGYTASLLRSLPDVDHPGAPQPIPGEPANPYRPPDGCRFHPRCGYVRDECPTLIPELLEVLPGHRSACVHARTGLPELTEVAR